MPKKYVPRPEAAVTLVVPDDDAPQKAPETPEAPIGDAGALYRHARALLFTDTDRAERELLASAEAGCADAMLWLGQSYYSGMILQKDPAAAALWFKKAAEAGDERGDYWLGRCHLRGVGVKRSEYQARLRFERAAAKDFPPALFWAGWCAFFGRGQKADPPKGFAFFRKGAFLGYAPCVYALGYCFEGGRTVPKSFSTAVNLYRRAGKLGFPLAWEKLGDLYAREGARFDPERAKKYYLLAYRAGITRDKAKAAKVGETKDKR